VANTPTEKRERPWRLMVLVVVGIVLLLMAVALWSEREDARTLPAGELEGVEEGFEGPL
jgi:hypothetical protein